MKVGHTSRQQFLQSWLRADWIYHVRITKTPIRSYLNLNQLEKLVLGQKLMPSSLILVLYNYTGDKFDLKEFHDAVLLESALPMSILEELIEQYISTHK